MSDTYTAAERAFLLALAAYWVSDYCPADVVKNRRLAMDSAARALVAAHEGKEREHPKRDPEDDYVSVPMKVLDTIHLTVEQQETFNNALLRSGRVVFSPADAKAQIATLTRERDEALAKLAKFKSPSDEAIAKAATVWFETFCHANGALPFPAQREVAMRAALRTLQES